MTPLGIRDIKGPILIQGVSITLIFTALALILLIGLLILYWVKIKKKKNIRFLPPHEIALAAFERLKKKGLSGEEGVKDYYVELSRIIRKYLDRRFGSGISEMTTEECLWKMKESRIIPVATLSLLQDLLNRCDLVKFAGQRSSPEEMDSLFEKAQRIVDQTKEAPFP